MKANAQAMNDDITAAAGGNGLNWLLDDLVRRLAGAENAIVLSGDGLLLGRSAALDRDSAEHLAAMASAFQSLSRGVGSTFGKGAVRQTVVELEYGYLVVTEAGDGRERLGLGRQRGCLGGAGGRAQDTGSRDRAGTSGAAPAPPISA